ncbi:MAG: RES family NAD+ phosphorylase [Flavisolibacter sp.]
MIVYRLTNTRYASDLSGEGARINGGRWNHIGIPCLYTASSRALATLEYSVNVDLSRILRHLSMATIEIPDDIQKVTIPHLPGDWKAAPAPPSTKDFGSHLLKISSHCTIQIPSTVIPEEFIYIINPLHPLSAQCRIVEVKDFIYDARIKAT